MACPWICRSGEAGDLGPNLQGLAAGGSILDGWEVAAAAQEVRWPHLFGQVGGGAKLVPGSGYAAFRSDAVARACPGNSVGNAPRYASFGVRPASTA